MVKYLQENCNYQLETVFDGIYYIYGGMFPMQLVVTSKLLKEENFWLRNLTNDLMEKAEAEKIINEYEKYNHSKLHKSVMDIIVRANEKKFKEVRAEISAPLFWLYQKNIVKIWGVWYNHSDYVGPMICNRSERKNLKRRVSL